MPEGCCYGDAKTRRRALQQLRSRTTDHVIARVAIRPVSAVQSRPAIFKISDASCAQLRGIHSHVHRLSEGDVFAVLCCMADTHDKPIGTDSSAIPEFDDPTRPSLAERVRRIERGIYNALAIKRDTSLADGAGAPGTTGFGNYDDRNRK